MYKCIDCGHLFDEGEQTTWKEDYGEQFCGCPICKGDFEKTEKCKSCDAEHLESELIYGFCPECWTNFENDKELSYRLGGKEKTQVKLNSFLLSVFCEQDIEEILWEKVKQMQNVDCKKFIEEDKIWFAEQMEEVLKK